MQKLTSQKPLSLALITLTSGTIAYLDFLSPPEIPIDALYGVPIWFGLLVFGLPGGLGVSTVAAFLYYFSNFFLNPISTGHLWLSIFATYGMLLVFSLGAYRFLVYQGRLADARTALQSRLEELDRLHSQTRELHEQNLKLAVMGERNRIAREIHDVLAQGFTGIILQLEAIQLTGSSRTEIAERLGQIERLARYNLQEARRSVADLRPLPLDGYSLPEALERRVIEFGCENKLQANFNTSGPSRRLPGEAETALFRIAQEALSNVARHARAKRVEVCLDYDEDEICLTIRDDGRGFEQGDTPSISGRKTYGLETMQERARLIGGWAIIQTQPGEGCRIRVIAPYVGPKLALKVEKGSSNLPVTSTTNQDKREKQYVA